MAEVTESFIDEWIQSHKEEMIEELKLWVSQPSVSRADLYKEGAPYGPDCRKMLDLALERGKKYGFEVKEYEGYTGEIAYGSRDKEIGFVCHLDVVPEGDHWIYEPYKPVLENGFLIGRGVGDNKGSGVLCLFLLRFFKENNIELSHGLRLMLGCAEETGMADFTYYKEKLNGTFPEVGIVADAAFPVCYAQKGGFDATFEIKAGKNIVDFRAGSVRNIIPDKAELIVSGVTPDEAKAVLAGIENIEAAGEGEYVKITGYGKAGHAAFPVPGEDNNAIVKLARAAALLEEKTGLDLNGVKFIAESFSTPFGDGLGVNYEDEESGVLTSNIGVVSTQQGKIVMDIDIRYPVTDKAERIKEQLTKKADEHGAVLAKSSWSQPYYIAPEDKKVKAMLEAYREVTGDYSEPYSMGGGTYSRVVPNAISFGPGMTKRQKPDFLPAGHGGAHGPDEALSIADWLTGFKIYIQSVIKLDKIL